MADHGLNQAPASAYPRSAIVHDFFTAEGGAERCAIELARLLPDAVVHTSFFNKERYGGRIAPSRVRPWLLQRFPQLAPHFRALLPLYPAYFGTLDLRGYDLVVSSSIAFGKAVRTRPGALHVAYVYTPMRYAWDLDNYLSGSSLSLPARIAARTIVPLLRRWDVRTARRPDVIVAISQTVRDRIRRHWRRDALVIYPPVDTTEIGLGDRDDGFYLVAARLLAYRHIELAVAACTELGSPLHVVGDGPERTRLEAVAGPSIRFLGHLDRAELVDQFRSCHAYLVPGVEDFGIAPVEAMAAGKPVVALRAGGVTETVVEGVTGVFFDEPTADAMADAIRRLDLGTFEPVRIRAHALTFDTTVFHRRWRELLQAHRVDPGLYPAESEALIGRSP